MLVPVAGEPALLRHAIEASAWAGWPSRVVEYTGWRELRSGLEALLSGVRVVAMESSPDGSIPAVDRVPAGVVSMVESTGTRVVSSADLVTRLYSRWSDQGLVLHRRAAEIVRRTAIDAFHHAARALGEGAPATEGELASRIHVALRDAGVDDQVGTIVAGGTRSADPHYKPDGAGEPLASGEVVLIDLWGAIGPNGVPADQTWMGFLGDQPPERVLEVWSAVREARDAATGFLTAGRELPRGYEVDRVARDVLGRAGFGERFVHRLGHSIDTHLHGSGPNLDDLETRDARRLIHGIGFSVEPGIYLPGEFGVRSEVNVYLGPKGPEVTPGRVQSELLRVS